jgi:hypothetical protein
MAKILKIELSTFYKRCSSQKIRPIKTEKNINFYIIPQFQKEIIKFYPVKSHEVFHIYESKMNNEKNIINTKVLLPLVNANSNNVNNDKLVEYKTPKEWYKQF